MSQDTFLAALKSTVDKLANQLAVAQGITYVDLDDATATAAAFKSDDSNIVMEFNNLDSTRDPLYKGSLNIGARTVQDPGNYEILKLMGLVANLFPIGDRIQIKQAYEVIEGAIEGSLIATSVEVQPQQYDLLAGVRLLRVEFVAQRFV